MGRTKNVIPDSHQVHKFFLQCWHAGRHFRHQERKLHFIRSSETIVRWHLCTGNMNEHNNALVIKVFGSYETKVRSKIKQINMSHLHAGSLQANKSRSPPQPFCMNLVPVFLEDLKKNY
jgi:hypothetical protein